MRIYNLYKGFRAIIHLLRFFSKIYSGLTNTRYLLSMVFVMLQENRRNNVEKLSDYMLILRKYIKSDRGKYK